MAMRIEAVRGKDGAPDTVTMFEIPDSSPRGHDGAALVGRVGKSAAQEQMDRIKARSNRPKAELFVAGSGDAEEKYFIRHLNMGDHRGVALYTSRDENGALSLDSEEDYTSFVAACLFFGLGKNENGERMFEKTSDGWLEAYMRAEESDPTIVEHNTLLVAAITLANPDINPKGAQQLREMQRKADELFLNLEAESLKQQELLRANGSAITQSISMPSDLPTDSSLSKAARSAT